MKEKEMMQKITESVDYLKPFITDEIKIAIVAGSGLGKFSDLVSDKVEVSYADIPHFRESTVVGHAGKLIFGYVEGQYVALMAGRVHFYEGYSMQEITYPIRVFQALGIDKLLLTNACGGMHDDFRDGAIMLITDHINLMGDSPLVGENLAEFGTRFPGMNGCYTAEEREKVKVIAAKNNIKVFEGVYAAWKGPAFETPAEIRFIKGIGADAVGMSTAPEVLVAAHGQMKVVAISCITNMAAGLSPITPNHEEVIEMADKLSADICLLVKEYVKIC